MSPKVSCQLLQRYKNIKQQLKFLPYRQTSILQIYQQPQNIVADLEFGLDKFTFCWGKQIT